MHKFFIFSVIFMLVSSLAFSDMGYTKRADAKNNFSKNSHFRADESKAQKNEDGAFLVKIDVIPQNDMNLVNQVDGKDFDIAILGSNSFDVSKVDLNTLKIKDSNIVAKNTKTEDVNNDGIPDLILTFSAQDLNLDNGDNEIAVEGKTKDGESFKGKDTLKLAALTKN